MSESLLRATATDASSTSTTAISVVIPCFNEAGVIDSLAQQLDSFQKKFAEQFQPEFIFVDDGSSDATHEELLKAFGGRFDCQIVKHATNRGIAAAILTGILAANNEVVVSMDSDCTYDPLTIDQLVNQLDDSVSMVTASPYHPYGQVVGVPGWRLLLSKSASYLYRFTIGVKLHTYTSCFRAYRRSKFVGMQLSESGFVGIAEMLWLTSRQGGKIAEVPATLSTRQVGYSKLRTLPVIRKHLALIRRIHLSRLFNKSA